MLAYSAFYFLGSFLLNPLHPVSAPYLLKQPLNLPMTCISSNQITFSCFCLDPFSVAIDTVGQSVLPENFLFLLRYSVISYSPAPTAISHVSYVRSQISVIFRALFLACALFTVFSLPHDPILVHFLVFCHHLCSEDS